MDLSVKWLKEYVDIKIGNIENPEMSMRDYCEAMSISGSKVEGYEHEAQEVTNTVVGKILKVEKHPDAEKLVVCSVDVGEKNDGPIQIVTAATNVFEGAVVPVALNGSTLCGGIKIKTGKLRGVVSQGMFCSVEELGVTVNDFPYAVEDGILIIQEDCNVGDDIKTALGLTDTTVEFEITSNRPDCFSVSGLARETAATFGKKFQEPCVSIEKEDKEDNINNHLKVSVLNENLCTRYNAKMVKNVKIGPSPRWMREYLRGCGIRPINNIVDITNYVCLEYGQPMHAFDYRYVNGGEIIVRNAKNDEKITTLDGIERILTPDILVIADTNAPVAVAGVMGGEFSGVMDDTTTIVFEAASFNNVSVRKTSRKLALRTESSSRFEKGLPEDIAHKALLRACHLVEQLECGEVLSGEIDIYPNRKEPVKIKFEPHFINKFIGINISQDKMVEILNYLNFKVENDYIVVPSFRTDIEHKSDIAEEIARIYGYNNIPSTTLKGKAEGKLTQRQLLTKKLSSTLCSCGLNEIMTYSFISPKYYDKILMKSDDALRKSIVISNPLGEDTSVMRTTALPSILEVISRNINYRNDSGEFYELATEYIPTEEKLPQEIVAITLGMYGEGYDFFTIKGIIEKFLRVLKYKNISFCANCENPSYHPGRCADVFIGEDFLGTFGEIHPNVIKNYDISQKV
ncbi:MAG: phenylalanine--tRNA ligase subunit beta, partial [Clostridia bacterium]